MCQPARPGICAIVAAALLLCAPLARAQTDDARTFTRDDAMRFNAARAPAVPATALPQLRLTVTPLYGQGQPGAIPAPASPASTGTRFVCVRTCDGYFFPVSGSVTDRSVAEFMCRAGCPGATVKLYSRVGDAAIETAVGADRSLYARLKTALTFRTEVSPSCSCRRPNGVITNGPLYDDPTLREGDVIVVAGRALVFKGAASRPYTARDFAPLERSTLAADARQQIAGALYFRASVATARRKARGDASQIAQPRPLGTPLAPRVILAAPFDPDAVPATVSAFASER